MRIPLRMPTRPRAPHLGGSSTWGLLFAERPRQARRGHARRCSCFGSQHPPAVRLEHATSRRLRFIHGPMSRPVAASMLELTPIFWARTLARLDAAQLAAEFGLIDIPADPLDTCVPAEQKSASS